MIPLPPLTTDRRLAITPQVSDLLGDGAPVAVGVSGGKDSCAVAFATMQSLDEIGHTGPRVLIHADLGATEWHDSLPTCQRLADRLGVELIVVRRLQGDMMERWEQRWRDNVERWETLSCVKLILPWSTPAMRFCTAELKIDQICRALSRRWPGKAIVSVTGIRREESSERAKAPISQVQPKLASKTRRTSGVNWNAIADWTIGDVWGCLAANGFERHEAYTRFGASRVSCVWCILATESDHQAGARDERNHDLGRRMVTLEIASTFGFQGGRWLGDTIARILTHEQRAGIQAVKHRAVKRQQAESRIPKHLLYTKGWPTCVPTRDEAVLLSAVRFAVADAVGLRMTFVNQDQIIARYQELMAAKEKRRCRRPSPTAS